MTKLEFKYAAAHVLRKPKEKVTKVELNRMKRAWAYLMICRKARIKNEEKTVLGY